MNTNANTMMAAPAKGQENKLARREAFAEVARTMDALAVAAQDAFAIKGNFERTFALGAAMADLRDALDEKVMTSIMKLQNTKLGFRTDNERGYPVHVVKDAVIEATVWGLQCVGNQFNILAGNFYATKEGYTYLLRNLPGLDDMKFIFHPAVIKESSTSGTRKDGSQYQKIEREGIAVVDVSWVYNGVRGMERLEFCIRVNAGMSQDAIIGKAERKAKAWLHARLTDMQLPDGDVADMADVVDVPSSSGEPQSKPVVAHKEGIKAGKPVVRSTNYEVQSTKSDCGADGAEAVVVSDEEAELEGLNELKPTGNRLHPELHGDDAMPVNWPEVLPLEADM